MSIQNFELDDPKNNLYEILGLTKESSTSELQMAYYEKLNFYENKKINDDDIYQIKLLNICKFILFNDELKNKYDMIINKRDNSQQLVKYNPLRSKKSEMNYDHKFLEERNLSIPRFRNLDFEEERNINGGLK